MKIEKLFPPVPRYGQRFINTRAQSKISDHDLLSDIEISYNFLKQFPLKYCSKEYCKSLENFKEKELKLLERQAQNSQYNSSQKR